METLKGDYAVMAAKNGEKALRLAFAELQPDVILQDIMMPGMDGYKVCQKLKDDERTRDIPVLFITAQTEEEDEARGLAWARWTTSPSRFGRPWSRCGCATRGRAGRAFTGERTGMTSREREKFMDNVSFTR